MRNSKYLLLFLFLFFISCDESSDDDGSGELQINMQNLTGDWRAIGQGFSFEPFISEMLYLSLKEDGTCFIGTEISENGYTGVNADWSISASQLEIDYGSSGQNFKIAIESVTNNKLVLGSTVLSGFSGQYERVE